MANYVIGDVQGCFEPLLRLLDEVHFNEREDFLWFVGDLVNRGPQSLEVLRFIKHLPNKARVTLGNHDLHLLALLYSKNPRINREDTLNAVITAEDKDDLGQWLRQQSLLYYDKIFNVVICHAGIAPLWTVAEAQKYACEVEDTLRGDQFIDYLNNLYGNIPDLWDLTLTGIPRLRLITNYFTRMRYVDKEGRLIFHYKGTTANAESRSIPWYALPQRQSIEPDILFGHWAALNGVCPMPGIYALDTGCFWGGKLTALRLEDRRRFAVRGLLNK